MICHLKMGFITFLFTFHGPTVILSFGRIWSSLMYFLLAISFIALTLPYPPCYQGPFLFFSKLSYEEFLTNFSHFLFYNLCRSDFIYILSLYFGMIFPKENNWLASDFLFLSFFLFFLSSCLSFCLCVLLLSHSLQDPDPFLLFT